MTRKVLAFIIVSFILITTTYSQNVDEIISKMDKARGNPEVLSKITSMLSKGTMSMMSMSLPFTQYIKEPNLFRYEQEVMGQQIIIAFDGKTGWMINPMSGKSGPEDMTPDQVEQYQNQKYALEGPLVNYKERGIKVESAGTDKVDGKDAIKLKLITKNSESQLWIDASTYYPVKQHAKSAQMGQQVEVDIFFSGYKSFDGLMMPTNLMMTAGSFTSTTTFDSVELNKPMDDSLFKKPAK